MRRRPNDFEGGDCRDRVDRGGDESPDKVGADDHQCWIKATDDVVVRSGHLT